jgi:hypothetical protein
MRTLAGIVPCLMIFFSACSTPEAPLELTADSTASLVGDWLSDTSRLGTGAIVSLQILGDGRFVRVRCLDAGCDRSVPEDGHWIAQKTTLRFYLGAGNQAGKFTPDPKTLLDTWTFSVARARLTLTRRGVKASLAATSDASLCVASGGAWSSTTTSCDCGTGWFFVAGEAGCVPSVTPSESLCDATGGAWSDDDNILIGTYCECPRDEAWVDGTGCSPQ